MKSKKKNRYNIDERRRQLSNNEKSVFISYTHEDVKHVQWVIKLSENLRRKAFDVVMDIDENPEPGTRSELIKLSIQYEQEFRKIIPISPGIVMLQSPVPLFDEKQIGAKWSSYFRFINKVISLIGHCRNVLLITTPRYMRETLTDPQPDSAGWIMIEFQMLLRLIINGSNHRIISVLRKGNQFHQEQQGRCFPMIDFTENTFPYKESIQLLTAYLKESSTPPDWKYEWDQATHIVKCLKCEFKIPYTDMPKRCNYCETVRPKTRQLCSKCGFNKFTPFCDIIEGMWYFFCPCPICGSSVQSQST